MTHRLSPETTPWLSIAHSGSTARASWLEDNRTGFSTYTFGVGMPYVSVRAVIVIDNVGGETRCGWEPQKPKRF